MADEVKGDQPAEEKSVIEDMVRALFRQGQYGEAVPTIQSHLTAHADDVPAFELLADALRFSGDKAGAAGALSTASQLYARKGMVIQSIAAQKRAIKLGVEPDYSASRVGPPGTLAGGRVTTPLFDDLSEPEFRDVAEKLEARSFDAGATVVEEGQPGDSMFIVSRGTLEVSTRSSGGEVKLGELRAGDFFGEAALLSGRPRTATIRATSPTECLLLSRAALAELTAKYPRMKQVMEEFNRQRAVSTIETLIKKKPH